MFKAKAQRILGRLKNQFVAHGHEQAYYGRSALGKSLHRTAGTQAAVVVHLFYTEMWPDFIRQLKHLNAHQFDLFITLPVQNADFASTIQRDFASAQVVSTPNRGRDVLPFIKLAAVLDQLGYQYVLKLHSKKSTHRTDGNEWLSQITSSLLPADSRVMDKIINTLESSTTGIIGPQEQYLSLPVNYEANRRHILAILARILGSQAAQQIDEHRDEYGFFAGTMFWARFDAIRPVLLQGFAARVFEPEQGQIDATFAHALERVFCLIPELEGKRMYEAKPKTVVELDYKTDNIPDWSDVYVGPTST